MANKPIEQWTRQECEEYLKQYPKSLNSDIVRKRLVTIDIRKNERIALYEEKLWNEKNNYPSILYYIKKFPQGKHLVECDEILWNHCNKCCSLKKQVIREYIDYLPNGKHKSECDEIFWQLIDSIQDIHWYRLNFPKGRHIHECDNKIEKYRAAMKKIEDLKKKEFEKKEAENKTKEELKELAKDAFYGIGGLINLIFK